VGVPPAIVSAVALQKVALGALLPWLLTAQPERVARSVAAAALHDTLVELESFSTGVFAGEEAREGMAASSERRAPSWVH
jgi:hypothetical protein